MNLRFDTQQHYAEMLPALHGMPMKSLPFAIYMACSDPEWKLQDPANLPLAEREQGRIMSDA